MHGKQGWVLARRTVVSSNLQVLDFVADTSKIGLETQKHLLHPCENSITALNLRDRQQRTKDRGN